MSELFRREVVQARNAAALGAVVLRPPLSFAAWSLVALALAAALLAFLLLGEYTKRARVVGITAYDAGQIKVLAPVSGIVVARNASEGQSVAAGEVLFVLSAERMTGSATNASGAQSAAIEQLRKRRESLSGALSRQNELAREQAAQLSRRIGDLRLEARQAGREIETVRGRWASTEGQIKRLDDLGRRGFMSEVAVQQKREEAMDQQARLLALERARSAIEREAATLVADLRQLPIRAEQQVAEIERQIAELDQELARTEASRQVLVTAPRSGVVTAILADKGQAVGSQPLLTLLPEGGTLEAHLFAPSKAIGFVQPGQQVRVRYAAFPYQKFGQHAGTVEHVSRSALAANELPGQFAFLAQQFGGEGLYKITVSLASASVMAYGKPQHLTAGMQLEADVLQDRRRLFEWIVEPVLSLHGKL